MGGLLESFSGAAAVAASRTSASLIVEVSFTCVGALCSTLFFEEDVVSNDNSDALPTAGEAIV